MAIKTEGTHAGEYIISESSGTRSRESVVLATGDLAAGTVLGQVTTANTITIGGSNVGDGVMGSVTIGTDAINGTYVVTCTAEDTNAGTFSVTTPGGVALDDLTVAVAYVSSHINVTLADGAEDFDVDDTFSIDVLTNEYAIFNAGASDGTETAKGILFDAVDASGAEQSATMSARDCEVTAGELVWNSGTTSIQKVAAETSLKSVGIILR